MRSQAVDQLLLKSSLQILKSRFSQRINPVEFGFTDRRRLRIRLFNLVPLFVRKRKLFQSLVDVTTCHDPRNSAGSIPMLKCMLFFRT